MTQEERWIEKYSEVKGFIEANKRNPSKFVDAERELRNWVKHQRKLYNANDLHPDRVERFIELIAMIEKYKRKNQYE